MLGIVDIDEAEHIHGELRVDENGGGRDKGCSVLHFD